MGYVREAVSAMGSGVMSVHILWVIYGGNSCSVKDVFWTRIKSRSNVFAADCRYVRVTVTIFH